jgi:hypothetical protein
MNTRDVLALLVCLSFAVKVGDWLLVRRGDLFLFAPSSGWLRYLFATWSILLGVLAALALASVISTASFVVAGAAWMICSQTGAILVRHRIARPDKGHRIPGALHTGRAGSKPRRCGVECLCVKQTHRLAGLPHNAAMSAFNVTIRSFTGPGRCHSRSSTCRTRNSLPAGLRHFPSAPKKARQRNPSHCTMAVCDLGDSTPRTPLSWCNRLRGFGKPGLVVINLGLPSCSWIYLAQQR